MLSQNLSTIHVQMQFPEVFYSRELDSDLVKKDDQKSSWLIVLKEILCRIFRCYLQHTYTSWTTTFKRLLSFFSLFRHKPQLIIEYYSHWTTNSRYQIFFTGISIIYLYTNLGSVLEYELVITSPSASN